MTHLDYPRGEESTALRRFLFRETLRYETPREVVTWWERRRLPFNLAVGSVGVLSIGVANLIAAIGPGAHSVGLPPLIGMIAYAGLANVMFTGGWIAELILRPHFGRRTGAIGATLFRYGLVFSLGLTSLPIVAVGLDFGFRILKWVLQ